MATWASLPRRPLHLLIYGSPHQKLRYFSNPPEISLANLLRKHIFPFSSHLHEVIQHNPFVMRTPSSDPSKPISLLQSLGFSQNSLLSVIHACPKTLDYEFLTRWNKGFFELGLTNAASASTIQMILVQSASYKIEPEDFIRTLRQMKSVGFSSETVIRVFEAIPAAFMRDGIHVSRTIEFLKKSAGIKQQEELNKICQSYPEFLAFSINDTLRPLFSELSDLGFDQIEVRKVLIQNPNLLLSMEFGELSRYVNLLEGLKCRTPIKKRVLARGRLCAVVDIKIRIELLCNHGLIQRDALKILHVEPRSILYSQEDLEKKILFLMQQLGFNIDHLVEFPDYLGVNLEKQIIPRLKVVDFLKSKGVLEMVVELKHFVRLSRRKFYNFFVKPYPECEKIFGGLMRDVRVNDEKLKRKHPTGLWKLFKPQKYSESEEDVKNTKQFMDI
ncbi:hypothetical protein IEQ34_015717 [Dendrobium chrysotoxum]|uniref:Uncharacterized protein n=1 Tax=Dendrobium chrysotoxum TaxID=161865 RepID=A0AAV7G0U5_DENCH|nr:hypothetical protein IEQ34_015717 [Dendrobium chrysotoxum]